MREEKESETTKNLQNSYGSCLEVLQVVEVMRAALGLRLIQPLHREVARVQETREMTDP